MKCNWRRWLWGIIPLAILSWVAVYAERRGIEHDLNQRGQTALTQAGMAWATLALDGRDVVVSGKATQEGEPAHAADTVRGVWGVRIVDNRADVLEKVENYVWAAGRRGNRIRLTGYVPSAITRQSILGVTRANFPGFEVSDRLHLARGIPAADTWLAGVSFALKQLAALKRGDVRLEGLGLSVFGEAEDVNGYRSVKSALAGDVPKGIKVLADEVTPPVVSPFVWRARLDGNHFLLSGYAPSDSAKADVMVAANGAKPGAEDRMQPAGGAPEGWSSAAAATLRALVRLDQGKAELRDSNLTIAGIAADEASASSVRSDLHTALPAGIKFIDHIHVREVQRQPEPAPVIPQTETSSVPKPQAPAAQPDNPPSEQSTPPVPGKGAVESKPEPSAAQSSGELADHKPEAAPAPSGPVTEPPSRREKLAEAPPAKTEPAPPAANRDVPAKSEPAPAAVPPMATAPRAEEPKREAAIAKTGPPAGKPETPQATVAPPARTEPAPERQAALSPPPDAAAVKDAQACEARLTEAANAGSILFRVGSAELNSASSETLANVANAAKSCPGASIEVDGHASAEGSSDVNQQLSVRRAQAVIAYLVRAGVEADRLRPVGYGSSRPVAPNDTSENMAKNRRIEFVVRPR